MLKDSASLWVIANFKYSAYVNGIELISYGANDVVLLKINLETKDIKYYQLAGTGNEAAAGLAKSGNQVVVAGSYTDEITFAGKTTMAGEFGSDIFVAVFGEDCTPISLVTFKGDKSAFPCSIISSGTGVYLAGEFTGTLSIDGVTLTSHGDEDIFIARIENCSARHPLNITVSDYALTKNSSGWILDAGKGFSEYSWEKGLSDTQELVVSTPGNYKVTVVDKSGCVYTDSVSIITKKSATIVPELNEDQPFKLYPTFTNNLVYWSPASDWVSMQASVKVFDIAGKIVFRDEIKPVVTTKYTIDFTGQPEGTYMVEISGQTFRETSKIVLKK